jgi:hypothetical protein
VTNDPDPPSLPPRLIIRKEQGGVVMWLTREHPQGWGDRERAQRYFSEGEARRAITRLKLVAVTVERES